VGDALTNGVKAMPAMLSQVKADSSATSCCMPFMRQQCVAWLSIYKQETPVL